MEKLYSEDKDKCKPVGISPEKIQFLLNFSKSLKITEVKGMKFESNLN